LGSNTSAREPFAAAFSLSLPDAASSGAMTLAMTLAANRSRNFLSTAFPMAMAAIGDVRWQVGRP
jgi:hypothetical protein